MTPLKEKLKKIKEDTEKKIKGEKKKINNKKDTSYGRSSLRQQTKNSSC